MLVISLTKEKNRARKLFMSSFHKKLYYWRLDFILTVGFQQFYSSTFMQFKCIIHNGVVTSLIVLNEMFSDTSFCKKNNWLLENSSIIRSKLSHICLSDFLIKKELTLEESLYLFNYWQILFVMFVSEMNNSPMIRFVIVHQTHLASFVNMNLWQWIHLD